MEQWLDVTRGLCELRRRKIPRARGATRNLLRPRSAPLPSWNGSGWSRSYCVVRVAVSVTYGATTIRQMSDIRRTTAGRRLTLRHRARTQAKRIDPLTLVRAPYLQRVGPTEATVVWRTVGGPADATVRYGTDPDDLSVEAVGDTFSRGSGADDHVVRLDGLDPATRYHLRIEGAEAAFTTSPARGESVRVHGLGRGRHRAGRRRAGGGPRGDGARYRRVTDRLCPLPRRYRLPRRDGRGVHGQPLRALRHVAE